MNSAVTTVANILRTSAEVMPTAKCLVIEIILLLKHQQTALFHIIVCDMTQFECQERLPFGGDEAILTWFLPPFFA